MEKIGRPTRLIAYDTDVNIRARMQGQPETTRIVRPRTLLYAAVMLVVGGLMAWGLTHRAVTGISVIHDRNPEYVVLSDGGVRNAYMLRILNKHEDARRFAISVDLPDAKLDIVGADTVDGSQVAEVGPDQTRELRAIVSLDYSTGNTAADPVYHHRPRRRHDRQHHRQLPWSGSGEMKLSLPTIRFAPAKALTGRKVLAMLIAFFGVVIVVNVFMVKAAISTFGGVDTKSSYEAGRMFEGEVAKAAAQTARDWQVDEQLTASGDEQVLAIDLHDAQGAPVTGVDVEATLAHPVDERNDVTVKLAEIDAGTYRGQAVVPAGVWEIELLVVRGDEQLFRSKNRVIVP